MRNILYRQKTVLSALSVIHHHKRHSCGILQHLHWVRLPVSQLQGDAHDAQWIEEKSHYRTLWNTSLMGGDDICRAMQTCPPETVTKVNSSHCQDFKSKWNSSCHKTTNTHRATEICMKTLPYWQHFKTLKPLADPNVLSMEASASEGISFASTPMNYFCQILQ